MTMKNGVVLGTVIAVALATNAGARAQKPADGMFPFVLPWSDSAPGTVTDVSWMNTKPAGATGYIVANSGHFTQGVGGRRINFLATNFAAKAAFPSHADAEKVAARLAKLGINLVRMHHMDNSNWGQESSIWDYSFKDRQHISAAQLEKLDYLIAQFKKNGIYVNLNLHVSRQFSEADGFPPSVNDITFGFDKRVDEFDSRMFDLQKRYAHDLLTHVNPYTGLSYCTDPAIAVVEINNENSLVGDPWANYGADLDTLPEPFKTELVGLWNLWLQKRYKSVAALNAAWMQGVTRIGPGLLNGQSQWSDEHQGESEARLTISPADAAHSGAPPVTVNVLRTDGTDWHVQIHQTGLDLREGDLYTVSFRAKADAPRPIPVTAGLDQADWHNIGLSANAAVTTEWKEFSFSFKANSVVANHCRVALVLGGRPGTVQIDSLQLHAGADGASLQNSQDLQQGKIAIPTAGLPGAHDDWIEFLADTERIYAEAMRRYIKEDLKAHANIICSQISWGGLTGIRRENSMDFADNHAYWQHPSFPGKPWDPENWFIPNTSMAADLAAGKGGTFKDLAEFRVYGKPYTVSEYNHPAPNDFRAECTPLLALFAAVQDWDAVYLFDYGDYGTGVENDRINGYFGISSDPAKTAFLPAAAMIFRGAEIMPGNSRTLEVSNAILKRPTAKVWPEISSGELLNRALSINPAPDNGIFHVARDPITRAVRFAPIGFDRTGGSAALVADTPNCVCIVGLTGGKTLETGAMRLTLPPFGNNFAAIALTPMDKKPIQESGRMLLTLVGKVENQEMVWNAQRTSVGSHWGHGPTIAEGIPADVRVSAPKLRTVWALDGTGKRTTRVPAKVVDGKLEFKVGPEYRTLWYELAP